MKTSPVKTTFLNRKRSDIQQKLKLAVAASLLADRLAKAAKDKAHQAKIKFKADKKIFKLARKAARKAAKKARQAQKKLKACLDKVPKIKAKVVRKNRPGRKSVPPARRQPKRTQPAASPAPPKEVVATSTTTPDVNPSNPQAK